MTEFLLPLAVLLGFAVEAAAGFGATVVAVSLAAQALPVTTVLAAVVPVNLLLSGYIVLRHGRFVDWRLLGRRILPCMAVGMAGGLTLFEGRGQSWLRPAFGIFVVALSLVELAALVAPGRGRPRLTAGFGALVLVAGGFIHGLFACGGPMVVYYAGRERIEKAQFRSTLSAVWLLTNAVLLAGYFAGGQANVHTLRQSALLLPSLVAGIAIGEAVHARLRERPFRAAVFALLLMAGAALLRPR